MSNIAGNTSTSEILSPNRIVTSTIDNSADADWFRVSLTSGLSYSFTVAGFGGPGFGMPDPDMFLYNSAGTELISRTNGSLASISFSFSPATSGRYFIGISDNGNTDTGGYRLSWVATDTITNNTQTDRTLAPGQTIASRIDVPLDSDWFKVTLKAGLSYGFRLATGGGSDPLEDGDLFLRDANGNVVFRSSNGSSTINTFSTLISQQGTYYVEVNDNGSADTGTYTLDWVATDSVFNSTNTTRTLARNTFTTSRIDVAQDSDWFKVTLTQGLSYGFQVAANGLNGLPDGDLFLRDATGNLVLRATNGSGTVNTLGHTATASGTYFIEVSDNGSGDIGAYILRNLGLDVTVNSTATTLALRDGTSLSGRIDVEGDSDWVRFRAEQGVTYQFLLSGTGGTDGLDNVRLYLRDAAGNQISTTAGPTGLINWTATTDGTLYLDVRGRSFADKGAFVLSVISTAPTLNGTAAADRLTGGSNNTVINGFDGNDILNGGAGNDVVFGGLGLDMLLGGDGNDTLSGGSSADSLSGGAGGDRINGGAGNDVLRGGLTSDIFIFNSGDGSDTIVDFQNGADRIEIQSGATSMSGLSFRQIGDDVRVVFGTTTILIQNVDRADLSAADFLFT